MDVWWRRRGWSVVLLGLAVALAFLLGACGTAGSASSARSETGATPASGATQKSEGGQVTVAVTWQGPAAGPVFRIALDTHAVELDGYDLRQLAVLRIDKGREVRPSGWDAPKGGHHREGTLTFPATTVDGSPVIGPNTRSVELVIRAVAGVPERIFRWTP